MYEIEKLNLTGEIKDILNKGKTILLYRYHEDNYQVFVYEQSAQKDYKMIYQIMLNKSFSPLDITMLSNEIIVISGRNYKRL